MTRPPVPPRAECRDCAAPIVFVHLTTNKLIPVNPVPHPRGNVACRVLSGRLHGYVISAAHPADPQMLRMVPHHATCPAHTTQPPADRPLF